jgi:hypothetical protein
VESDEAEQSVNGVLVGLAQLVEDLNGRGQVLEALQRFDDRRRLEELQGLGQG